MADEAQSPAAASPAGVPASDFGATVGATEGLEENNNDVAPGAAEPIDDEAYFDQLRQEERAGRRESLRRAAGPESEVDQQAEEMRQAVPFAGGTNEGVEEEDEELARESERGEDEPNDASNSVRELEADEYDEVTDDEDEETDEEVVSENQERTAAVTKAAQQYETGNVVGATATAGQQLAKEDPTKLLMMWLVSCLAALGCGGCSLLFIVAAMILPFYFAIKAITG